MFPIRYSRLLWEVMTEASSFINVLDLRVEVLPGFRVEGFFSLNKSKDDTEKFTSPEAHEFNNKEVSESGRIEISNKKSMTYEGRVTLSYNKMFGTELC